MENGLNDPGFSTELKVSMALYSIRLTALTINRFGPLIEKLTRERMMGWRQEDPEFDEPQCLTAEILSKRLDKSNRPMFIEEVTQFLEQMRFLVDFPYKEVGTVLSWDIPLVDQFTHEEFLAFCLWLNNQTAGVGDALYAGPLVVGKGAL